MVSSDTSQGDRGMMTNNQCCVCAFVRPFVRACCRCVWLSVFCVCAFVVLSVCMSVRLFVGSFICVFMCLVVCMYVCTAESVDLFGSVARACRLVGSRLPACSQLVVSELICSAASFSELSRCLLSVQVIVDCILSVPSGRCCSLFVVLLIELRGSAVCYCVLVVASGLAEYSPLPLPSVVPCCPFPCRLGSVSCILRDLFLSVLWIDPLTQ